MPSRIRAFALVLVAVPAFAAAVVAATAQEPVAGPDAALAPTGSAVIMADASDLPPGCANHWKTPNVRERRLTRNTYLHEMSNNCVPYGPINGTVLANSIFRLYFADPYEPAWCYGYSVNLARKGYVLCDAL